MNIKFPVKIYKHQFASLMNYVEQSGYTLEEEDLGEVKVFHINHPWWAETHTPFMEKVKNEGDVWEYFLFIRLVP